MNLNLRKFHSIFQYQRILYFQSSQNVKFFSSTTKPQIPESSLKIKPGSLNQPTNGEVYDKKPFKMTLEKGKIYHWCLCGRSHTQPLCDGTHKNIYFKLKHKPIKFSVDETKEYWLCNCKQTKHRPFCDGTHKSDQVQETLVRV